MRGLGQIPPQAIENYNSFYENSAEKEKEGTRQPESEKLPSIVPTKQSLLINPQVDFPKLTPRSSARTRNFLNLRKHTNTAPIDEGSESSEKAPKADEPSEKQPDKVTASRHFTQEESELAARNERVPPSASVKDDAANPSTANLSAVIPLRKNTESFGSEDPWKAPPDGADFHQRKQEYIDPLSTASENPTESLTKLNRSTFNERQVLPSPRYRSITSRMPVISKKKPDTPLDPTHSNVDRVKKEEKITRIEFVEEKSGDPLAEKKKKALQKLHSKARSALPSARATALQVTSSIGNMIRELNEPASASKAMRALNILYYVASEKSFVANESFHPEIGVVAEHLSSSHLSPNDKFTFLKHLYAQVKEHLDSSHIGVEVMLGNIEIQIQFGEPDFRALARTLGYHLAAQAGEELVVSGHWKPDLGNS